MAEGEQGEKRKDLRYLREERLKAARAARSEIAKQMVTVMSTALAVVAGLFWQTAIGDTIKAFIPVGGAWQYELAVAFLVTAIAAITIYMLSRSIGAKK